MMLLVGGTRADRTSRRLLIICADLIALVSQLCVAFLLIRGEATVYNLAALMLITGLAFALHPPAIVGFIPQMVERKDLQAANALLGAARNGSLMLGAASAGILVATVGAGPTKVSGEWAESGRRVGGAMTRRYRSFEVKRSKGTPIVTVTP